MRGLSVDNIMLGLAASGITRTCEQEKVSGDEFVDDGVARLSLLFGSWRKSSQVRVDFQ